MNSIKILAVFLVLIIISALILIPKLQTDMIYGGDIDSSEIVGRITMSSISKDFDFDYFDDDLDLSEVFFPVNFQLDIEPSTDHGLLSVKITFGAYNKGGVPGPIPVVVEGEMIYTLQIDPEKIASSELVYTFEEPGTYDLEFGDQSFKLNVEYNEHNEDSRNNFLDIEDIPGFTWIFLILCTLGAVLILRKKN